MRIKKVFGWGCVLSIISLAFSGCVSAPTAKSLDEIILRDNFYTVAKCRSLSQKHRDKLVDVANSIRAKFSFVELEFTNPSEGKNATGLHFGVERNAVEKGRPYLCVNMYTTTRFNTIQSNYNSRAVTVFTKYGRRLFDASYLSDITKDADVIGISVSVSWRADNFVNYRGAWESVTVFAKTEDVKQFLNNEITDRDFISKAKVHGTQGGNQLGLIELDLSERM